MQKQILTYVLHIFICQYHIRQIIFFSHYFFLGSIYNVDSILIMLTTKLLSDNRYII